MMIQCDLKKKKFDLFARKKNLNYIAVAFTTRGADAPPMTKEEKGKKKEEGYPERMSSMQRRAQCEYRQKHNERLQ